MKFQIIINLPGGDTDILETVCEDFNAAFNIAREEHPNATSVVIFHVMEQ